MDKTSPITIRNMYRSILGRVGKYRGNRVVAVQGTIVGYPKAPLNELGFRNLFAKALDIADDGKAAMRLYVSFVLSTNNPFEPRESTLNKQRYLNSTFVDVEQADGEVVTCLHLIYVVDESFFEDAS